MRRLVIGALLVAVAAAAAFGMSSTSGNPDARRYVVELDNAFGLVEGGDARVAGVRAGRVVKLRLDKRTKKALVDIELTERGFGSLRSDVFCESRPQSPIGEYYLDCLPGRSRRALRPGSRIPIEKTASTIAPDLIQNIMRLPYRERFRLIVNEFGAGLAGRPQDLNEAVRRGVPALRQTARLLEVLAEHDRVIRDLVANADTVLAKLADNRRNVGKFVVEARDTASASAQRDEDISTNFRKLPRFLSELRPTMAKLGEVADEQTPVLVDLRASATQLRRFFDDTAEFSRVSRPAIQALGRAAPVGREAVRAARPQVRELRRYAGPLPDLARNLRIVLEDFDDPRRAVERDPRSPGGRGYSGTQAILQYAFNQALTNNAFDSLGYMVRTAAFVNSCARFVDAAGAKKPETRRCRSWLGPNQPGVTTPDPSGARPGTQAAGRRTGDGRERRRAAARRGTDAGGAGSGAEPQPAGAPPTDGANRLLEGLLGGPPPVKRPSPSVPEPGADSLLDYLLGP